GRRLHHRKPRRLLRRTAGDLVSRPRRQGPGHRCRRARRARTRPDGFPGVLEGDQRARHCQGNPRLGQHPGGLRRPAHRARRRGHRRRRRRGRGAASLRPPGRRGSPRPRGQRSGQAQAARRRRTRPGHLQDARQAGRQGPALHRLSRAMSMPASSRDWRIALIGYGEVGRILAEDLRAQGIAVQAHDIRLGQGGAPADAMRAPAASTGVALADSHRAALVDAQLVISAVTASQTVEVANACAPGIAAGAWFLDFNSASPGAKQRAAALIDAAGGRYVEGAVMTSIPPYRIRVPLLLGGEQAASLAPLLGEIGFAAEFAAAKIGVASATKMCRSIMIKGLEAMVIEAFTTARAYGVEDAVLASLAETFPSIDWEKQGTYFFGRVIQH